MSTTFGSIGLIGPAGSGKTTAAAYLHDTYKYTEMSFSTPVKAIAEETLGRIAQLANRPIPKNVKETPAGRRLLQLLGDELGRELIGPPHIWIDELFYRMQGKQRLTKRAMHFVVDDVRYLNEAYALLGKDFTLIRLIRDAEGLAAFNAERYGENVTVLDHTSESGENLPSQFAIQFSTVEELYSMLDEIVDLIRKDS